MGVSRDGEGNNRSHLRHSLGDCPHIEIGPAWRGRSRMLVAFIAKRLGVHIVTSADSECSCGIFTLERPVVVVLFRSCMLISVKSI